VEELFRFSVTRAVERRTEPMLALQRPKSTFQQQLIALASSRSWTRLQNAALTFIQGRAAWAQALADQPSSKPCGPCSPTLIPT